ncbi:MAG: Dabb family protein [Rhizobiales bacterium]|nr:Dabb family protein [Hyphomicrobiales bacterium]MBO6700300.1 Dabb family protein [Hyphomicrobiales bacterium]MBO6737535.1 Dabb family protein [Hyphomicrobiales bacterium]MBO6913408.1 Dabb family protein [Hyphomicrobiales bacterium]MBO6955339.1 Dabb family protein [Hyphomicrobiales bacterium]
MILHCVFCHPSDGAADALLQTMSELATFSETLEGVEAFHYGPNLDFEGKSPDHKFGFVIRFASKEALERYADHPTHQALGARLCASCVGGTDGIVVYDLDV